MATDTYAERSAVILADSVCLGIARKYREDNSAFSRGERPEPAGPMFRVVLADRFEELGLSLPPGYFSLHLHDLCRRVIEIDKGVSNG